MQWHGLRDTAQRVGGRLRVRRVHGIALGRGGEIDHGLSERGVALGHTDEVHGILCRHRQGQCLRVGVSDILRSEPDEPSRDVQRIFSGFEHASEPVHRRVGVAVAHRLMERGDDVVMLLA